MKLCCVVVEETVSVIVNLERPDWLKANIEDSIFKRRFCEACSVRTLFQIKLI